MKTFIIFILLLAPSAAFAEFTFDISCNNISSIRIVRINDTYWNVESYQGHFHVVNFVLTPDAATSFVNLRNAAPWMTIFYRGEDHTKQNLSITANGRPLRDDAPALTGFADQGITITIVREQDAFDTARSVCPALVPSKVLIDGQWE